MQVKDVTIRLQALDGQWETVGVDRLRGIYPENDSYSADAAGPSKCSFDLHRDPGVQFPDLTAFTPCEVEIGGRKLWSGRVIETPTREEERVVNVQGQGKQYHLDDDCYQRAYVHSKLGDYKDMRGVPSAELGAARLNAAGQVTVDGGQIYLGWPSGTALTALCYVGVVLDLGEGSTAAAISIDWQSSNSSAVFVLYARTSSTATNAGSTNSDAFTVALNSGASGTTTGTFSSPQRYVQLFIYNPSYTGTSGADDYMKLVGVRTFTDTSYQSSGVSVLKAPTIMRDAIDQATVLLSHDLSQIDPNGTVTFTFDDFAPMAYRTTREVFDACNAVHDYVLKVDADDRVVFKPKPSAALVEIGAWPGSVFDDASANSGDDIYNRVIVQGATADGSQLNVQRTASQQAGVGLTPVTSPAPTNPSFATNTTGWTASSGTTITRQTGVFDTSPASGLWAGARTGTTLTTTFSGTFLAGRSYVLTLRFQGPYDDTGLTGIIGASGDFAATTEYAVAAAFVTMTLAWTPSGDRTGVTLVLSLDSPGRIFTAWDPYIDSLALFVVTPTLVDRRGFQRTMILPVECSLTPALGARIGDVWLAAHKTTPLKGTVTVTGDQATREILTGASFGPERYLSMTGEQLQLSNRTDPDTGGQGRYGRIAEVTYNRPADEATVALDSTRTSYVALLKRLAIVVGGN